MAGLLSGWGANNPFYQGFDERRNAISGFGLGLMSGKNLQDGLTNGVAGAIQGREADTAYAKIKQEEQQRQEAISATTEWLRQQAESNPFAADMVSLVEAGALTPNQAFSEVYKSAQGGTSDWAKLNDGTLYNQRTGETMQVGGVGGMSNTEYGLTPIWGQFADGRYGMGVLGKDGSFKPVDTGDLNILDPRSLNAEKAAGSAEGKFEGEANVSAPSDLQAGLDALDILDQIETHPELGWATGTSAWLGANKIGGTGRYDFQNLVDQAKSGAFLSAVQQMRGMGALSNAEGQTATAAITRMDTATSKEAFLRALADYRAVIQRGVDKARARLEGRSQPSVGGYTILGVE